MRSGLHILAFFAGIIALMFHASSCGGGAGDIQHEVDSLNALSYNVRYRSAEASRDYAQQVISLYGKSGYSDGIYEAYINKAFAYRMLMRFDSVLVCCDEVLRRCNNDLLCAKADVCMMSVCNQTGQSKEFYDYRHDAMERLDNVSLEVESMTPHQLSVWKSVQAQYHLASLGYYARIRQDDEVKTSMEWLESNQEMMSADSTMLALWLVQKSVLGTPPGSSDDALTEQRRSIVRLLSMSVQNDYKYLVAESMRALSQSIMRYGPLKPSQQVFVAELSGFEPSDTLAVELVKKSASLFKEYGNKIGESFSLNLLSEYEMKLGNYSEAIDILQYVLQLVNLHHQEVNSNHDHASQIADEKLLPYAPLSDSLSTEMLWIADPHTITVPEWMASIREQLSIVYGAMGMKAESDYNHNIYFDILDATRLDLRAQQEEANLRHEQKVLNLLTLLFALTIVALLFFIYKFSQSSTRKYKDNTAKLSKVIDLCRRMTEALTDSCEDEDELTDSLHQLTDAPVRALFFVDSSTDWTTVQPSSFKGLDRELFGVLLVFYRWVVEKGRVFIALTNDERSIEAETMAYQRRFEDSKREYIDKLTSMGIVNGITPFLDRALREADKLSASPQMAVQEVGQRLAYVSELVDKINDYNDVLGHWAAIRKGVVSLHIENFALQPLLDTLSLGTKTFDSKGIALNIAPTEAVVKADKSLTLFMMNTLLDNARKYTPEGGSVSLLTYETEQYVEVAVEDTGHGMNAEDVDTLNNSKVYDSCKIGTDAPEEVVANKGFGFGLMNCKGIIEKYRKTNSLFAVCQFRVESEVGKGSRFSFRLPKGVQKVLVWLLMVVSMVPAVSCSDEPRLQAENGPLLFCDTLQYDSHMLQAKAYLDSVYSCNVYGEYDRAITFCDSAIACLNNHYLSLRPQGDKLMQLSGASMPEIDLWKEQFPTDYNLIISLRNEAAISALSLNKVRLYRYNSEVFTRLYRLLSSDDSLDDYCASMRHTNRNKKATVVVLGIFIVFAILVCFLLYYRHNILFALNLRQFIRLTNKVFSASDEEVSAILRRGMDDVRTDESDDLMQSLVQQIIDMHRYYSTTKLEERNSLLELKDDERRKAEMEEQKVHVQNQIMDNCISTLKHETMYYPSRIKQLISTSGSVADIHELLLYYKQVFSILSECAGKQIERVLFKRSVLTTSRLFSMIDKSFRRQAKKAMSRSRLKTESSSDLRFYGDSVFLQVLIDNVLSLFFEHSSGGDLHVEAHESDGFIYFTFTDTLYTYADDVSGLFYVDNVHYDSRTDTLSGMQYIVAKQIIREHDDHCNHRGCRIFVTNNEQGGSSFVFTLPKAK